MSKFAKQSQFAEGMSSAIVRFHLGEQPDHRGRFLSEIQRWDHARLESVHDFIQWLFPLPEPSPVNPLAPVLDAANIRAFASRPELRDALAKSFHVMAEFYGFTVTAGEKPEIHAARDMAHAHWLTPGNHNLLRITRILRSTRLLGMAQHSSAFFAALEAIYQTDRGSRAIGTVSFRYWKEAAMGGPTD